MATPIAAKLPLSDREQALKRPRTLLGGLSPDQFMRSVWQRKPLVVRQALSADALWAPSRAECVRLAGIDGVESRLVQQTDNGWTMRRGPLPRSAIPPWSRPGWTLLVQGMDLHAEEAHQLLRQFDFIPQARLDDVMVSYASDQGGVGPHVDSYDVFLVQVAGRRRWRVAPPGNDAFVPELPLRILACFEPTEEWVLEPGDLLYLPPGWGHEGVALGGDCMTASIGFRAPTAGELVVSLLQYCADEIQESADQGRWSRRFADRGLRATATSGAVPEGLLAFAQDQLQAALRNEQALQRALGAWVTEPKPQVMFEEPVALESSLEQASARYGIRLDRRTRMAYDAHHCFINGEAFRVGGRDASLLRQLADARRWDANDWKAVTAAARAVLLEWMQLGWIHPRGA